MASYRRLGAGRPRLEDTGVAGRDKPGYCLPVDHIDRARRVIRPNESRPIKGRITLLQLILSRTDDAGAMLRIGPTTLRSKHHLVRFAEVAADLEIDRYHPAYRGGICQSDSDRR